MRPTCFMYVVRSRSRPIFLLGFTPSRIFEDLNASLFYPKPHAGGDAVPRSVSQTVPSSLVSGGLRRGGLLLQHDHRKLALSLLLVVAIGCSHLRHLLKELLTLYARRHTREDGEVLPPDLHLGRWVGT